MGFTVKSIGQSIKGKEHALNQKKIFLGTVKGHKTGEHLLFTESTNGVRANLMMQL